MQHVHKGGIATDRHIVAGVGMPIEFQRSLEFVGILAAEQTKTFEIAGTIKSIVVSAAVDGVPTADVSVSVGDENFGMPNGPLQWRAGGQLVPALFKDVVEQVVVTNREQQNVRLSLLVGFDPVVTSTPTEGATE